jgi:hypothetical protein
MVASQETAENIRNRLARHKERRMGIAKKKVLMLLFGGLALGLSGSPRTSWKVIGGMVKEWKELSRQAAERAVNSLYASKLVSVKENYDGTLTLVLSEDGRKKALRYNLNRMKIQKPSVWDKRWRMISFDIPEDEREARDAFREHLLNLGFYELHRSFFIYPFPCAQEIEYIIELYDLRKYVRVITATHIDNELAVKKFFGLQ